MWKLFILCFTPQSVEHILSFDTQNGTKSEIYAQCKKTIYSLWKISTFLFFDGFPNLYLLVSYSMFFKMNLCFLYLFLIFLIKEDLCEKSVQKKNSKSPKYQDHYKKWNHKLHIKGQVHIKECSDSVPLAKELQKLVIKYPCATVRLRLFDLKPLAKNHKCLPHAVIWGGKIISVKVLSRKLHLLYFLFSTQANKI